MRTLSESECLAAFEHEVSYVYQPVVSLNDSVVRYVEGLVRWRRDGTNHPPADLLAQLTTPRLVDEFTRLGLAHLLGDLRRIKRLFGATTSLGFNLSWAQLQRGAETVAIVQQALETFDVAPTDLRIEVVEDVSAVDLDEVRRPLQDLRAMGLKVMLDDFGMGASSLAALTDIPYDGIKIDRHFVSAIYSHPPARSVIEAVVTFGRSADIEVVAEGVEDAIILNELTRVGCELVQGFFFGHPIPIDALRPTDKMRFERRLAPPSGAATPTAAEITRLTEEIKALEPRTTSRTFDQLSEVHAAIERQLQAFDIDAVAPLRLELLQNMAIAAMYCGDNDAALNWGLWASSMAEEQGKLGISAQMLALMSTVPSTSTSSRFVGVEALARCMQLRATAEISNEEMSMLDNTLGATLGYLGMTDRAADWWNKAVENNLASDHPGDAFACVNLVESELARLEMENTSGHPPEESRARIDRALAKLFRSKQSLPGVREALQARYRVVLGDIAGATSQLQNLQLEAPLGTVGNFVISRAHAMLAQARGDNVEFLRMSNELCDSLGNTTMLRHHRMAAERLRVDAMTRNGLLDQAIAAQEALLDEQAQILTERSSSMFDFLQVRVDFDLQFAHLLNFLGFENRQQND